MGDEVPLTRCIASQRGERELARPQRMRGRHRYACRSGAQRVGDALAHLAGCLARERHRHDLLRPFDGGEQREIALDQELGLARSCRRLHEKRARDVQRLLPRVPVLFVEGRVRGRGLRGHSGVAPSVSGSALPTRHSA
jgi:hypothetical protein